MDICIKDFIIKDEIPKAKEKAPKNKTEYTFSVAYENDTDFIIKRTTLKTEKLLVVLVSQGQCYIKDVKQNEIEDVTSVSQIQSFKRGMTDIPKFNKLTWRPFKSPWYCDKVDVSSQFDNFITHKQTCKFLANKKHDWSDYSVIRQYETAPEDFNKMDETVRMLRILDPNFSAREYSFSTIMRNLKDANVRYNNIKDNVDIITEIGVDSFIKCLKHRQFGSIIKDYLCDFKTLLTYMLYTIKYRNGLCVGSDFSIDDYADYLRMQKEMYGKVKEKYPLYWLSEKQMLNNKYNAWLKLKEVEASQLHQEEMEKYIFEDDLFRVVVPTTSADIIDEAHQQQHCVASYVDRIKAGKTHVVFVRDKRDDTISLLTIEITPELKIVQVRGFQNRNASEIEYEFLKKWAQETGLELGVKKSV